MSAFGGGRKTPSISGSRQSVYSHTSTVRTLTRTGAGSRSGKSLRLPWYKKPLVSSAFYTDLQRGSWHIGFYTLVWIVTFFCCTIYDVYLHSSWVYGQCSHLDLIYIVFTKPALGAVTLDITLSVLILSMWEIRMVVISWALYLKKRILKMLICLIVCLFSKKLADYVWRHFSHLGSVVVYCIFCLTGWSSSWGGDGL